MKRRTPRLAAATRREQILAVATRLFARQGFRGTTTRALAAGAGAMNAIGTAVTGGMLSATFIDLVFIPLFFVLIVQLFARRRRSAAA